MADSIRDVWRQLCCEIVLSKHYPQTALVTGFGGVPHRNPVLEEILPSLLYVKMVAVLDYSLKRFISDSGLKIPKKDRNLNGRIDFLDGNSRLKNAAECHRIRKRRNKFAHETNQHADWGELENDVAILHEELEHLGFVGTWEQFEFFGERSGMKDSDDPSIAFVQDITYGVKLGDEPIYTIQFSRNVHRVKKDG